jgi:hypothetical protein
MSPSYSLHHIYRYVAVQLFFRQLLADSSSNPVDTGPPQSGSWSFKDNVKVVIIIVTMLYVGFVAYLFFSTYQTLLKFETRLDALVGQEKSREIKEHARLEKEALRRDALLLRLAGKSPEPPPALPAKLVQVSAQTERYLSDNYDESNRVDDTSKMKKTRKRSKGWKSIAM